MRGGAALSNFCLHTTYAPSSVRVVGGGYRAPEVASTPWACSCWSSSWQVPDARVRAPTTYVLLLFFHETAPGFDQIPPNSPRSRPSGFCGILVQLSASTRSTLRGFGAIPRCDFLMGPGLIEAKSFGRPSTMAGTCAETVDEFIRVELTLWQGTVESHCAASVSQSGIPSKDAYILKGEG